MQRSWSETQSIAERAALGAGVPFAQAARFGAGVARHLAEGRTAAVVAAALEAPETIVEQSLEIERAIEAASLGEAPYRVAKVESELLISGLQALPCAVSLRAAGAGMDVSVHLGTPQAYVRAARIEVPEGLWAQMDALAARLLVPESEASRAHGAGAGLMELE